MNTIAPLIIFVETAKTMYLLVLPVLSVLPLLPETLLPPETLVVRQLNVTHVRLLGDYVPFRLRNVPARPLRAKQSILELFPKMSVR